MLLIGCFFILLIINAIFAQLSVPQSATTPQPSLPLTTQSSKILDEQLQSSDYVDYHKECSNGMAVISFKYKLITGSKSGNSNNTSGSQLTKRAAGLQENDVALTATCSRPVDDKALSIALSANKLNDTSIECRDGETFNVRSAASETDYTRMCKPGEYIAGATSVFWNSQRLLKLKCCQTPALFSDESMYPCYDVPADQSRDSIRSTITHGDACPVDVLTGVTLRNDSVIIGRYCALLVRGLDYSNTVCKQDRHQSVTRLLSTPQPKITPESIRKGLPSVQPNERTSPGRSFKVECSSSEAVSGFSAETFNFASNKPSDLSYAFSCSPIGNGNQTAVRHRHTPFSPSKYAEIDCMKNDAALCAVYSQYDSNTGERSFSYACCEYSNARLQKANSDFQAFMVNVSGETHKANRTDQFIQRLVMQESKPGSVFFKVSFSSFNRTSAPTFNESSRSEFGQKAALRSSGSSIQSGGMLLIAFLFVR